MSVACVASTDVPAYSEMELVVETPVAAEGTWLLEGVTSDRVPVVTARAVVCPTDRLVTARIINPTAELVRVQKDTKLGQVERLPDSTVVSAVTEEQLSSGTTSGKGASDETLREMVTGHSDGGQPLSPTQQEQLLQVLKEHRKAFAEGAHDHGRTNRVQHYVHTGSVDPIARCPAEFQWGSERKCTK